MSPPSICGSFLKDKRSLVAFTWTLTTVLTLVAFVLAIAMTGNVHAHYIRMDRYYTELLEYSEQQEDNNRCDGDNNNNGEGGEGGNNNNNNNENYNNNNDCHEEGGGSADTREYEMHLQLGQIGSKSVTAVALYTVFMAVGLSMYGSTTIVGFTSMRGDYISPCFSPTANQRLKIGMFGGAIVLFANLLFVCAMVMGEVRVEDWTDRGDREDMDQRMERYEVERISTILAVTCMFLAPLYIIFAVLLFFFYGGDASLTAEGDAVDSSDFYALDGTTASSHHHHHHAPQYQYHPNGNPNTGTTGSGGGEHHHHTAATGSGTSSGGGATPGTSIIHSSAAAPSSSQHPPPPIINHLVGPGTNTMPRIGSGDPRTNGAFF